MILHPASRSRRLGLSALTGGDRLTGALAKRLDDDWHWFPSVAPGGMEPIDAVLVGPGGTWAFTHAGDRGRFAHRNGHWYRWNRSTESWVPWEPAPVTRARLAGRRLALYLEAEGLPAAVTPVLEPPAGMEVELAAGDPIGVTIERAPDRLVRLVTSDELLTQQQVDRIVAALDPRQPLPRLAQATRGG